MPFGRKHGRRATLTSADRGFTRGIEPLEVRQFLSGGFHPFVGGFGHEGMPRTIAPPTEVAASPRRDMGGDLQAASHPSVETFHFARPAPRETSFGSDEGGWRNVDGLYGIRPSDRPEQDEAPVGDRGAGGGKVLRITQISIVFGGSENAPPSGPASSNGGTEVRGPGMGMKPAAVVAEATSHPSFVVVTVPTGAIVVTPYVTGPGDGSGDGIDASASSGHPSGAERSIKRHLAARTARSRPAEANETRDDDPSDGTFAAAVPAADAAAGSDVGRAGAWRGLFGEVAVLP